MSPLSRAETAVTEAVDADAITGGLAELVAIPSVDGAAAEVDAQQWCASRMRSMGMAVDTWDIEVEQLRADPDFPGMEVQRKTALGCVGVLGGPAEPGSSTPALALYGHTDVVPSGELSAWNGRDPFRLSVEGELAYGRGTCDMKAGVVASLAAIDAVCRAGTSLRRPLAMHCVSAEEDGGIGAFAMLRRGHRADAVVITEPTSGEVVPANAGSLTFRLEVDGLATHGSTRSHGVSAVRAFERVHEALRQLESRRNADFPALFAHLDLPWPLSVGVIRSGDWASTVPDRLVAEGRYGVRIGESIETARLAFEVAVAGACADDTWLSRHPVRVTWPGGMFASAALPEHHPLLEETAGAVVDVRSDRPRTVGAPYGSDLRHYSAHGIPALQYGPGDVRFAHATDEHVRLADVVACARVYAVMLLRACG